MAVSSASVRSAEQLDILGVGVLRSAPQQLHVVVLYRLAAEQTRACHLAFHLDLRDEPAADLTGLFWADAGLDDANKRVVAAFVANLHRNSANIPYGFDSEGCSFDRETAEFLPAPPGKGLTCATFVTGVFNFLGFQLLKHQDWPSREDDRDWQRSMIQVIREFCQRRNLDCEEHIALLGVDIGAVRIRPEEAAAGVITLEPPLEFIAARALGDEILQALGRPA
jgi:hypothetical protein